MPIQVPNQFPSIELPYRLAIVGEAPGRDEEQMQQPFVGPSGQLLGACLNRAGIMRSACYVGNVSQYRPYNNDFAQFDWNGPEVQSGLNQLRADLSEFRPHLVLALGNAALHAVRHTVAPTKKNGKYLWPSPVNDYRGTLFTAVETTSPAFGRKCMGTFHPAAVLRTYEDMPLLMFDIRRAKEEAESPELVLPQRTLEVDLTTSQMIDRLNAIQDGQLVAMDIEGGIEQGVTCISFATSPDYAFIVDFTDRGKEELARLLPAVARVLCSDAIPKILQNSLYDNFVLSWLWRMPIRNVRWDTMLSAWELYAELPKGLATQVSLYTKEPYYKFERKIDDKRTHHLYCCKDSATTFEIATRHNEDLSDPLRRKHFELNMALLPAFNYMELRGFRYDLEKSKQRLGEIMVQQAEISAHMEVTARMPVNPNCNNGPNSLKNILFGKLGYPPQYKKVGGRRTTETTADAEALLDLLKQVPPSDTLIYSILKWRVLEGQRKQLAISADNDGRVRCGYNLVGTPTGRVTCYESPTMSGTNLQTIMKVNRDLYIADPGMTMFQCDLSGADGWTVAAHCQRAGDATMMQDLLRGNKPALILATGVQGRSEVMSMPSESVAAALDKKSIPAWLYFASKCGVHGTNYGMKEMKLCSTILRQSWKHEGEPIYVDIATARRIQSLYRQRYTGLLHWHEWVQRQLYDTHKIRSASGSERTFFGRPSDNETFNAALAHEPQANTTYATSLALYNLWTDPENIRSDGTYIIEPIHQIHDALVGQFPSDRLEWALDKLRTYFNNALIIAGMEITIPFSGVYGDHWTTEKDGLPSFN